MVACYANLDFMLEYLVCIYYGQRVLLDLIMIGLKESCVLFMGGEA